MKCASHFGQKLSVVKRHIICFLTHIQAVFMFRTFAYTYIICCFTDDHRLTKSTLPFTVCGTTSKQGTNLLTVEEKIHLVSEKDTGQV